ncbi:cytochrome P450 reductase C [Trypanosoma conorhini]|uniref:NADPH--hemoprotein reductase n=1 Tax=Trypanosoma conorhini TaxID=83891 RepID=A0A3S5ISU3_9TRYP|nr:cytochrome P450 reductase C [Trypanosoma conorhini]RNF13403.1 cytochrome P450 reductase C [Trypanosoma conorhini]
MWSLVVSVLLFAVLFIWMDDLSTMLSLLGTLLISALLAWLASRYLFDRRPRPAMPAPRATPRPTASGDKKEVSVLFGTQTGTAEMFAKTLVREGTRMGVPMKLIDVENYERHNLEYESLVLIICATYGEGEPTDSMKEFHDWLMDDAHAPGEELRNVNYAVFGLGDRQYRYFCEEGIAVDRRMAELGAQRIYGLGCGDAGQNIEEDFDAWRRDLWPAVGRTLGVELRQHSEEPVEPECRMKLWDASEEGSLPFPKLASVLEPTQRLPAWVPVVANIELLRNTTERSTRYIELDIEGTIISYQSGDHLGILPHNTDATVDAYLQILGIGKEEASQVFSLQDKKTGKNVFPARVTVRTALKWYIDLNGHPKKSTLRAFAHYAKDPAEKEALLKLLRLEPESMHEFAKLSAKLWNIHGFLRKFYSISVPLGVFLEMMPRIAPRYFSISSDLLSHPHSVAITAAIVQGGLCTGMLRETPFGEKIPVFVRKSKFHLPLRAKERPIVMIGPGTGVAPLIGFLHRRIAWKKKGNELGKAMLFFGCRRKDEDHIYSDFMAECLANGTLSVCDVAYSREQAAKVYVQHRVRAREDEIWEILRDGGNLYLCGDAKHMAKDVEEALVEILQKKAPMSEEAAKAYLVKLHESGRYLKDVWSAS